MKAMQKKLIRMMLVPLFALICHPTASAYYDPGVQRWISRDPLGERGFSVTLRHKALKSASLYRRTAELSQGPHLYSLVGNSPLGRFDAHGLSYGFAECAALLGEIDFLFSLKGRTGIDDNAVQRQINALQDEYDENCSDDDDGDPKQPRPVPVPVCPAKRPDLCKAVVVAAGGATATYIIYRCVRMVPSFFPPLWGTIPVNIALP